MLKLEQIKEILSSAPFVVGKGIAEYVSLQYTAASLLVKEKQFEHEELFSSDGLLMIPLPKWEAVLEIAGIISEDPRDSLKEAEWMLGKLFTIAC